VAHLFERFDSLFSCFYFSDIDPLAKTPKPEQMTEMDKLIQELKSLAGVEYAKANAEIDEQQSQSVEHGDEDLVEPDQPASAAQPQLPSTFTYFLVLICSQRDM